MHKKSIVKYRFRLTFFHFKPGFFRIPENSVPLELEKGQQSELRARDADTLAGATKFHIEGRGFPDQASARACGERLRDRLRVLNAMLELGLVIPLDDSTASRIALADKEEIYKKTGRIVLETIVGLCVFPDSNDHVEFVFSTAIDLVHKKPDYVLDALRNLWRIEMTLDTQTDDALNIMNMSVTESSPRAGFLVAFLALERLIDRMPRSEDAINLLTTFQNCVRNANLGDHEKSSLIGALGNLCEESFSTALARFSRRIKKPNRIGGMSVKDFFSKCIDVRNKIAHGASLPADIDLGMMSHELRKMVLTIIWITHRIPMVSVAVPGLSVSMPDRTISIRAL